MQYLDLAIRCFNNNLIAGSFISMFIIILTQIIFSGKVKTENAVEIFRWVIIAYTFLILVRWVSEFAIGYFSGVEYVQYVLPKRAVGPYRGIYWCMVASQMLLPLVLFCKKLSRNIYFLFLITLLMNFGWLFESLVLHITFARRDYIPTKYPVFLFPYEWSAIINGIIWGVLAILIGHFIANGKGISIAR